MLGDRTTTGLGGRTTTGLGGRTLSGVSMMTGELPDRTTTVYVNFKGVDPPKDGGKAKAPEEVVYYNQKMTAIMEHFQSEVTQGLATAEAKRRLEKWGVNSLPSPPPKPWWRILAGQFGDFMIMVLCFVALFELVLQEWIEASVLIIVVLMNVIVGFQQEVKAERALAALESLTAAQAKVFRDGAWLNLPSAELVPGDIVALEEGDLVPADLRLFEVNGLYVDEARLTGEAEPIEKIDERIMHDGIGVLTVGDRRNMAFMSTLVTSGVATAVVVNTGSRTQIGKISSALAEKTDKESPMQSKLERLGKILVFLSVFLCLLVIAIGIIRVRAEKGRVRGEDWRAWFKVGISLAVAVIPEGLVAVVTVALAVGVQRISKVNAIVRNMSAVETLGSVTVICSDKTGTLTEGKMRSEELIAGSVVYGIAGTDIIPEGEVTRKSSGDLLPADNYRELPPAVYRSMQVCALCNNSSLGFNTERREWEYTGDPTEVALEVAARKLSLGAEVWSSSFGYEKVFEIPFTSDRKRMTGVFRSTGKGPMGEKANSGVVVAKGAMGFLLPACTSFLNDGGDVVPLDDSIRESIETHNHALSGRGLRTLALAYRDVSRSELARLDDSNPDAVESNLIFCGLIAMRDPPRESVKGSIAVAHGAGIRITMITGDHPTTASAIAKQLGIIKEDEDHLVATGAWVDSRSTDDLVNMTEFPKVFARVSPANKLALVRALKARGNIVAMTGDGVNDAPAIKHADVGVAMGQTGTDLTIQSADIVLLDDDFNTIVFAVEEGRLVRDNLMTYLAYLLACNGSEIMTMMAMAIAGLVPPFSPVAILYANVIIDVPPSLALGIDVKSEGLMHRLPRDPKAAILSIRSVIVVFLQACSISVWTVIVYLLAIYVHNYELDNDDLEARSHARSLAFVTQACIHLFHSYPARSMSQSVFNKAALGNKVLNYGIGISLAILIIICYIPGLGPELDQWPLNVRDWAYVIGAVIMHLLVTEVIKSILVRSIFLADADKVDESVDTGKPKFFKDM
ncbi:ATPase [Thecamonas trahens ATCC 50062]|uniref:ATPase n=1 Tax=Thecamonas trahens ATCC 50062 TaxID=461836 RepID=A0A0L0DGX9_THETB|nr:ATPase [Thecamonas trahens ATCC 50062]KNC51594.1 ATPase [Thecamonas trahens ATCC 50062]|eukprot:XP_013755992.1 ATPase [Thecamonas trahens ATCC 50062]